MQNGYNQTVHTIRWIARVLSGFIALTILFIFIGEALSRGILVFRYLPGDERLLLIVFAVVWLGLVVSWKWELVGAVMTLGGMTAFYFLHYLFSGGFPRGPYFFIMALPGLLFLICGLRRGECARSGSASNNHKVR